MATDATGTPTSLGIPKFNTAVDSPSGLGGNAQMDAIDALIAARVESPASIASGEVPVWNGSAWVRSSVTRIGVSSLGSGTPAAGKYLAGDGTWTTLPSTSTPAPVTSLPGSPADGDQALLVDSLTAPTRAWLCQYESSISDAYKWIVLSGQSIVSYGQTNTASSGYTTVASVTAPNAGVYNAKAFIWAGNGASAVDVRDRINGVVQRTMAPAGAQYSRSQTLPHLARVTIATAGHVLDVQAQANGSDATYSEGSVELEPIRII